MLLYCGTGEGAEWTWSQINKSEDDLTAVGADPGHHCEWSKHVTTATITKHTRTPDKIIYFGLLNFKLST